MTKTATKKPARPLKAKTAAAPSKRREKGAQRLARDIVRHIYETGMQAGDRYYSEAEALAQHGVARGTLREALRYLQIQGVIDIKPGPRGGHFVAQPDWQHLASTLALLLQFAGATTEMLIEARGAFEPGMAAIAAAKATKKDIAKLDAALADMDAYVGDYEPYYRAYMAFWNALAEATQNPVFVYLSPAMRRITQAAGVVPSEVRRAAATARVRKVRDAVAAKDVKLAYQRMVDVEESYSSTFKTEYPAQSKRVVSWATIAADLGD